MPLGPRDISTAGLMTGWDATALKKFELEDGTTIQAIAGMLNTALGVAAAELSSGLWAQLVSFTDRPDLSYRVGVSSGFQKHTEYGRPDAQRGETEGHMLPLEKWDRGLGWTYDYLTEFARMDDIESDIADVVKDAKDIWRQRILRRLLKRSDDSGENIGLGTGGYSPGFATAAANTNVDFTPVNFGGRSFTSAHEHYVSVSGGWTNAVFKDIKAELAEHGHAAPYAVIASPSDEDTIAGLSDFIPTPKANVNYGANATLAAVPTEIGTEGVYAIGTIHECTVWIAPGMPQHYNFGWKPYGPLSQRNPLRIRLRKGMTRPVLMAANDPRNGSPAHPLQFLMVKMDFGVGVGTDRTNGTARFNNNSTWSDGTPT
jgi:hypothetical protein